MAFSPLRTRMIFHPPLFPYVLGLTWAAFGSLTAVKVVQAVAGAALVPAVALAAAWAGGPRVGVVAGAMAALYPELVWYSVHLWSEPVFMALLWWALERTLAADARGGIGRALVAGALWGLASLARETALYFAPLAALWLAARRPFAFRHGAALLLATVLTVAPWTVRNWMVFRAFIPVSTMGALNVWQGNGGLTRDELYARYKAVHGRIEQYRYAREQGLEAIARRQPRWLIDKLVGEMPRFWSADSFALNHIRRGVYGSGEVRPVVIAAAAVVIIAPYLAALALFVLGLAWTPLDRARVLLLAFVVYYTLLHVVTYGYSRFRLPLLPAVLIIAAQAVVAWREGTKVRGRRRRLAAAAVGLALALAVAPSLAHLLGGAGPEPTEEGGAAPPDAP
ncbi:MAG TPA: glycosyltransferase family 39 protein [Vicinamibacteria bacterium]|nr:glycosyltransferase family 39 protein [Vicinamibacteria bacterium]